MNAERETLGLAVSWWLSLTLLGPLLWMQGRWARWRTPRLPPLAAPLAGTTGHGETTLHLLVLGESPAAGVGVTTHEESLPACLALELAQGKGATVAWRSIAENGADVQRVISAQLPLLAGQPADLVLVVLGVNDTTGLTSRVRWRAGLRELVARIRIGSDAHILFTSLPRMDSFTALPQPLRAVLGMRGRLLERDLRAVVATMPGASCAAPLPPLTSEQLAADRYHPSALACRDWAAQLAGHMERYRIAGC